MRRPRPLPPPCCRPSARVPGLIAVAYGLARLTCQRVKYRTPNDITMTSPRGAHTYKRHALTPRHSDDHTECGATLGGRRTRRRQAHSERLRNTLERLLRVAPRVLERVDCHVWLSPTTCYTERVRERMRSQRNEANTLQHLARWHARVSNDHIRLRQRRASSRRLRRQPRIRRPQYNSWMRSRSDRTKILRSSGVYADT